MKYTITVFIFTTLNLNLSAQSDCKEFKELLMLKKCCISIFEKDSNDYNCNVLLGNHYLSEAINYPLALNYSNRAINSKPDSISAYILRFEILLELKENENAFKDMKFIKKNINRRESLGFGINSKFGHLSFELGLFEDAYDDYYIANKSFIDTKTGNNIFPGYLLHMARAKQELGQNEEALKFFNQSILVDNTGESLGNRAKFYIDNNQLDLAENDFESAIKKGSLTLPIMLNYAFLSKNQGQNSKYEQILKKCIELFPEEYKPIEALGFLYFEMENISGAKSIFKFGINKFPNASSLYFGYGITCFNNNEKTEGCLNIKKAMNLGDSNAFDMYKKYCN
ncbi:tetratricopeptide repeat protein [Salmonirosea aquatica]|uniref:Tetratricopeptide repeat protein n=1 Tax=Salmonirosea aquatica TaxID=2654236 RepID=A0A7C9BE95_9BACT|nr:hypothetical protein [Cytophagaceae bacterium SJW1-29]